MTPLAAKCLPSPHAETDARLRMILRTHFDPDGGTPYWLDRERSLGIDARRDIRDVAGLAIFGEMQPNDLATRPLLDFVPRRFQGDLSGYVLGQTGGTTGGGVWTSYRPDEFNEAFVTPFEVAATHVGFPRQERWLYVGPSGPHIIGKVVQSLSGCMGSHDPFSVDFDARWAKKLPDGSFAMERYLSHVIEQAMGIISAQDIGVIFTTPAVLRALAREMSSRQKARIRGIHYGGMEMRAEVLAHFQTVEFPRAVHLSGYGNTLFGCCLELSVLPHRAPSYFPFGSRLILDVVPSPELGAAHAPIGTVRVTRLDESFMIVRMLERDAAVAVSPPREAPPGFRNPGVQEPHSPTKLAPRQAVGLY